MFLLMVVGENAAGEAANSQIGWLETPKPEPTFNHFSSLTKRQNAPHFSMVVPDFYFIGRLHGQVFF
jgi:hypothetical protein